jgi:hypothetical protein
MAVDQRANITFSLKLGKTAGEAYKIMRIVYGLYRTRHQAMKNMPEWNTANKFNVGPK